MQQLVDEYGPLEKIILFGPQVNENTDEQSDVDLIIIKQTKQPFIERLTQVPPLMRIPLF